MKISIITVCYQASKNIRRCIDSVLSQTYPEIEYIVVDGGSTDGTVEILREYNNKISRWISESDNGIYDAMNKGIRLATGDVIGLLNSDDWFADQHSISRIAEAFLDNRVKCAYADVAMVVPEDPDRVFRYWKGKNLNLSDFRKGEFPAHVTFYTYKLLYEEWGSYRTDLKVAADYELMLRFLVYRKASSRYVPHLLVKMSYGGTSNGSISGILKGVWECSYSWKLNGLKLPLFMLPGTLLFRLKQVFNSGKA